MSWADDIRCLYCDGRLPLYRKITNGQFCSSAHRKAYWQEQERLAVERLHQTHDSLRAYRPAGISVEAILGQVAAPQQPEEERPPWLILANTGNVPEPGFFPDPTPVHPRWLPEQLPVSDAILADTLRAESTKAVRRPVFLYNGDELRSLSAGALKIPLDARDWTVIEGSANVPAEPRISPLYNLALNLPIDGDAIGELAALIELIEENNEDIPEMARLLRLLMPAFHDCAAPVLWLDSGAQETLVRTHLPLDSGASFDSDFAPSLADCLQLAMCGIANVAVSPAESAEAVELRTKAVAPELTLSTPMVRPRLRLAAGRRYAVRIHENAPQFVEPSEVPAAAFAVSLPGRRSVSPARSSKQNTAPSPIQEPNPAGLVVLPRNIKAKPSAVPSVMTKAATIPQPAKTELMRPTLRLEPINEAAGPSATPDFALSMPPYMTLEMPVEQPRAHIWTHAVDFWNRAPRDLKLLAVAIPVLLGLALHPALPKVHVAARPNTTGMERTFEQAMNTQWTNVRQTLVDRAAVALDEDFRSGLDDWASRWSTRTDGNAEWSFDATGFVRPGPLALYKPSVGLTDYQMQFLGMIDKKAMSWVVRAADFDNFYVVKLEVLKPGPLPTLGITRYAVVNGKADSRVDTVVPIDARADTLYRVLMDVHGDDLSLTIQGQMIDSWTEPRLKHGGVGFFSARGEDSRVRWVQVTHQYDMLGRLCAYLAPYNIPSSSGSLQP